MPIGTNIKNLRKQKGIKQKDLAAMLNMPVSTLANYENNKREPNLDTIRDICHALHVDSLKFFEEDNSMYMLLAGKSHSEKLLTSDDPLVVSIGEALVLLQGHIDDCIEFYYGDNQSYKESLHELIDSLLSLTDPSWIFEFADSEIVNTTSDITQFIKYKAHLLESNHKKTSTN
ncbi:MAG: helix-turn-helix transcriptional regulator [Clostridiales bacterium]|nr:helix-turn-helix transcriptional regulator [Clostridiales bacterium]MDU6974892.1 helix-turn-helix transcriptional regulator [Clostridiales bacterium]